MLHQMKAAIRKGLLNPIGRAMGAPTIHHASQPIGGGNYLYYWLWAFLRDSPKHPARVEVFSRAQEWIDEFALARHLSIATADAPRLSQWQGRHRHTFGVDFSREQLTSFCLALVNSSPDFQRRLQERRAQVSETTCVINVRRGDYYEYAELAATYGLPTVEHTQQSLALIAQMGRTISEFIVVSDDPQWCSENLGPILPGPWKAVPSRESMFDDLATLAVAPILILTNSTFSFWGAYIGGALTPEQLVVAPQYHLIGDDGREYRDPFDPRWLIAQLPSRS